VEKEATAIIDAVRKWNHFLAGRRFTLITDQKSVAFMLDNRKRTKVKNNKIQCWRLELAPFSYEIKYRPGRENNAPDRIDPCVLFCGLILQPGRVAPGLVSFRRNTPAPLRAFEKSAVLDQ